MRSWNDGPGVVEFRGGVRIRGRGLADPLPGGLLPEFALYLLAHDPGSFPWECRWVRWPDFRTPASDADAVAALGETLTRSRKSRVEIACRGGVGRTGTALAGIAVLSGVPPTRAVAWVRDRYHPRAVETPWQRRWVRRVDRAALKS